MSTQQPFTLEALGETYEVIGELAGRDDARMFIAKRRADGADVLIAVAQAPQGDQGNALSHLAADTNLLSSLSHRAVLPAIEGRWVNTDALAVVTPRVYSSTLEELLARRDEGFPYPRIAQILSEVNGALEWARAQKIVHRALALDTIFVESGTDRVQVSFMARALPLTDMPGLEEDARTIATLARAMLTRSVVAPERASAPLAELRPGLPANVVAQTETLLQLTRASDVPDVTGYIASIAMADALKTGDDQLDHARNAIEEQRREHQAQLEKERLEHDEQLAVERKQHAKDVADQTKRFQKEREDLEHQLAKGHEALAQERAALIKERAAHQRDGMALRAEREAHEREITRVREQLEWESAALATQAELYGRTAELPAPIRTPMPAPVRPSMPAPIRASLPAPTQAPRPSIGSHRIVRAWRNRPSWDRRWNKPAIALAAVLVIAVSAMAIGNGRRGSPTPRAASAPTQVVDSVAGGVVEAEPQPAAIARSVPADLIAGVTARATGRVAALSTGGTGGTGGNGDIAARPTSMAPGVPADFLASVAARSDSTADQRWRERERRLQQFVPRREAPAPSARTDTMPRLDTIFTAPARLSRPDSVVRRDSIAKPKPDSTVRRDLLPRDPNPSRDSARVGPSPG